MLIVRVENDPTDVTVDDDLLALGDLVHEVAEAHDGRDLQ